MRAVVQRSFGAPRVLVVEELPDLSPGPGEVRIRVEAAGVHLLDTSIRSGDSFGAMPTPDLPMTPGREVAGLVDLAGKDVPHSWLGRRVVAHLGPASGGYADQAVTTVDRLHVVPDTLDLAEAVAAIGTGRTALGILDQIQLTPYDVVLIPSAAGGLGALLVQGALAAGAVVVGMAGGPAKTELVTKLGAHLVVDYLADGWRERLAATPPATVVLDGVGGDVGRAAFDHLVAPGGKHLVFGWSSGEETAYAAEGKEASVVLGPALLARPGGLRSLKEEALARAADGSRRPLVGPPYALSEAWRAHEDLVGRRTHGKVVLVP